MTQHPHMIRDARILDYPSLLPKLEHVQFHSGRWHRDASLEPAAIKHLRRTIVASSAAASTRIEGAVLNDRQALEVIAGKKPVYDERSVGEVLGYAEALKTIFRGPPNPSRLPTRSRILRLHRTLMARAPIGLTGRYRLQEVNVTDGRGAPLLICALPDLIPHFMNNALHSLRSNWKSRQHSRLFAIAEFVAEFLAIHPFEDGNGRCARLLTLELLCAAGHAYLEYTSLERQIEKAKMEYYASLNHAQKTGELDLWMHFFLDTLLASQRELQSRLQPLLSPAAKGHSPLQKTILDLLRTGRTLRAGELVQTTGASPAGVRKVLSQLVTKRVVKAFGKNKGRYYQLAKME